MVTLVRSPLTNNNTASGRGVDAEEFQFVRVVSESPFANVTVRRGRILMSSHAIGGGLAYFHEPGGHNHSGLRCTSLPPSLPPAKPVSLLSVIQHNALSFSCCERIVGDTKRVSRWAMLLARWEGGRTHTLITQTDGHTDTHTHTDRHTDRHTDTHTDRHTDTHTDTHTDRQTDSLSLYKLHFVKSLLSRRL